MCNTYCVLISRNPVHLKLPEVRTLIDEGRPDTPALDSVMETSPVSTVDKVREGNLPRADEIRPFTRREVGSALVTRISKLISVYILQAAISS